MICRNGEGIALGLEGEGFQKGGSLKCLCYPSADCYHQPKNYRQHVDGQQRLGIPTSEKETKCGIHNKLKAPPPEPSAEKLKP